MWIDNFKLRNDNVFVINNSGELIFWNSFYGFIGYAKQENYDNETSTAYYTVYVGNHNTIGGSWGNSTVVTAIKRYINRLLNKYIHTTVKYNVKEDNDLARAFVNIEFNFNLK